MAGFEIQCGFGMWLLKFCTSLDEIKLSKIAIAIFHLFLLRKVFATLYQSTRIMTEHELSKAGPVMH